MKMHDFLNKIFKDCNVAYSISINEIMIDGAIDRKQLQNNLNLLSKEMHMEVELEATLNKKVIKHDTIYLPDFLSKIQDLP